MLTREFRLLLWLSLVHCVGIYLFTKGFLLSRLSLPDRNECGHNGITSLMTHKRAVLLVIDALRFDFISNHPPEPPSPYHHNILTLPRELTAAHPRHSFIFNAHADPPTTTLQRIKGLTTGSLPTFVDVGESFGGSAITEDSLLHQLVAAGRKVAHAGDDTWITLFPDFLNHNMSFPFDSFNVEDLHTVDEGVISNLLPLVKNHSDSWGLAIGHGLGVDHAGHRVGPEHQVMRAKLEQMNDFLAELVDAIDEDTLLILLGDHGMDRTGNHGGDSVLETMSAVWIYSKGRVLSQGSTPLPDNIVPTILFPGETVPHRSIQQIDLVPTISLLLGLPIPFNNLGSIIPEVFDRGANKAGIQKALELNANQIKNYLDTYRASHSGGELDGYWSRLSESWITATQATSSADSLRTLWDFNRHSLTVCRNLWARFSLPLMGAGLTIMILGIVTTCCAYNLHGNDAETSEENFSRALPIAFKAGAAGLLVGGIACFPLQSLLEGVHLHHACLFGSALASTLTFTISSLHTFRRDQLTSVPIVPVLHALCFASNSFTIWEDRIVTFLSITSLIPAFLIGFTAPTPRLRYRILGFSGIFAVCVRLMAMSTACREEQHPYCTVTFYASPTSSAPPALALLITPPVAFCIPFVIRRILGISKSDKGLAQLFLPWFLTSALLAGTGFWVLEWAHSADFFGDNVNAIFRLMRTTLAGVCVAAMSFGGVSLWWTSPACLEIKAQGFSDGQALRNPHEQKTSVTVLGFANAFGSPYLVFWTVFLSVVWLCTQLTGQIVLGLATIALLAYLEVVDSVRDVHGLNDAFASGKSVTALDLGTLKRELSFSEVVPLALLAVHTFHGTGHQPTIPSLQWKTAFILTSTVSFPFSQLTVIINTLGPHFLMGLASPLLALWNLPPLPRSRGLTASSLRAGLAMMLYFSVLLLGSAACAAALRRHLMVWKIFAPRYMFAAISLVAVDVGVLTGIAVGVCRVRQVIERIFERIA